MLVSTILTFHVAAGFAGLLSGTVAVSLRKGSRRHGVAGNVFVLAMLSMSTSGAYVAVARHQTVNFLMGVLTFYLVITGWRTARRRDARTSIFDWSGLLAALALATTFLIYGIGTANSASGMRDGISAPAYFIFGSVALLAAVGDFRMIVGGGVSGARRVARHLWRMCVPLVIAVMSLFVGQARLFPESIRKTHLLPVPVVAVLIVMIFWLIRVRRGRLDGGDGGSLNRLAHEPQPGSG